jgi:chromosome segregation ATPase
MKVTYRYGLVNNDTKPQTVPVTGESRNGWKLIAPAPLPNGPLNKYQTEVVVPAGGTAVVTNIEEQEQSFSTALADINLEKLDLTLKLKTLPPAVAAALTRIRTMRITLRDTEAGAKDEDAAIKEIKDDQTRIRANIERVPKESDAYKRYLKKFDDQETEIEDRTAKLKVHLKQLTKTKAELTEFLRDLKAE